MISDPRRPPFLAGVGLDLQAGILAKALADAIGLDGAELDRAVVFAADSKLTTAGLAGINEDGTVRWQDQTYDSATKIASPRKILPLS